MSYLKRAGPEGIWPRGSTRNFRESADRVMGYPPSLQSQYIAVLRSLLQSSGVKVKDEALKKLFNVIQQHCYWFHPEGKQQLNLKLWKQVGKSLRRAYQQGNAIEADVWAIFNLVTLALQPFQSDSEDYEKIPLRL